MQNLLIGSSFCECVRMGARRSVQACTEAAKYFCGGIHKSAPLPVRVCAWMCADVLQLAIESL